MTDSRRPDTSHRPRPETDTAQRDTTRRAELRVRDGIQPGVQEPVQAIRTDLEALAESGQIESVETVVWGRQLPLDPEGDELADKIETFQRFRAWALRNDVQLEPAFRVHEVTSIEADEYYTVVTVPLACLAVFDGDDVAGVYPHIDDGEPVTVQEGLERVATTTANPRPNPTTGSRS